MENTRISHYQVLRRIGGGGMGVVYAAEDLSLRRVVALKFLPEATEHDPQALERLLREARAASALNHPNICTVYEVGEHEGRHFIAMELVEGTPLDQRISGRALPVPLLLDLAEQIADALDAAHAKGIIHRDIKPGNILVTASGRVKIVDFGLAKMRTGRDGGDKNVAVDTSAATAGVSQDHLTSPGVTLGTLSYMSPEQARGDALDARSDLFSFGAVLYEMATGAVPFQGSTSAVIFDAILNRAPVPPGRLNSVLPAELDRVIHKALEKDRDLRYQSAAEMRADLRRLKRDSDSERVNATSSSPPAGLARFKKVIAVVLALAVLAAVAVVVANSRAVPDPRVTRFNKVTDNPGSKSCPFSAANLLYFNDGDFAVMQASISGGDPLKIPVALGQVAIVDISSDGSELLVVHVIEDAEGPLWILPVPSGSPRRVGDILAHDASFSPDGSRVAYVNGFDLFVARTDGTDIHKVLAASAYVDSPAWSPDGKRLRYRQGGGGGSRQTTYWEVDLAGGVPRPLFPGVIRLCCGSWTSDGRYFVYGSRKAGEEGLWAVREKSGWFTSAAAKPVLLSTGPLVYGCSLPSRAGKQIFVTAEEPHAELVRFDTGTRKFAPVLHGLSAESVSFSRDGQWIAYISYPEDDLWRSKVDGSQKLKLTQGMRPLLANWSPDGKSISFVAREPALALHLVAAEGGSPAPLPMGDSPTLAHSWSPDGGQIVLGEWLGTPAPVLRLLDLKTRQVSVLPGSEGLIYPIWSPDGRFIAADADVGPRKGAWLYDVAKRTWKRLPLVQYNYWAWSHDSQYIYYDTYGEQGNVMRLRVADGKSEKVADLKDIRRVNGGYAQWFGLGPGDSPLLLRNTGNPQIYALDWDAP